MTAGGELAVCLQASYVGQVLRPEATTRDFLKAFESTGAVVPKSSEKSSKQSQRTNVREEASVPTPLTISALPQTIAGEIGPVLARPVHDPVATPVGEPATDPGRPGVAVASTIAPAVPMNVSLKTTPTVAQSLPAKTEQMAPGSACPVASQDILTAVDRPGSQQEVAPGTRSDASRNVPAPRLPLLESVTKISARDVSSYVTFSKTEKLPLSSSHLESTPKITGSEAKVPVGLATKPVAGAELAAASTQSPQEMSATQLQPVATAVPSAAISAKGLAAEAPVQPQTSASRTVSKPSVARKETDATNVASAKDEPQVVMPAQIAGKVVEPSAKPGETPLVPTMHSEPISTALVTAPAPAAASAPTSIAGTVPAPVATAHVQAESLPQLGDAHTLTATPQALEVGVATGTHGWLRVRAEIGASGQVAASVVATTPAAAEALHRSLPALRDYLAQERVGVDTVAVTRPPPRLDGVQHNLSSATQSDTRGQERRDRQPQTSQPPVELDGGFSFTRLELPMLTSEGAGGWVSVRV